MKHSFRITLLLILLFLLSQVIGIIVTSNYVDVPATEKTGKLSWKELPPIGGVKFERPAIAPDYSGIYIITAVLIGTILMLTLIKFRKILLWKSWFYLAIIVCITFSLGVFIGGMPAMILGIIFGYYKTFKHNIYIHNITEVFIYSGMAAIFVPILNMFSMIILLILISIYDIYAVYRSKHMISMAKFQSDANVFAGLFIPYALKKDEMKNKKDHKKNETHASQKNTKDNLKQKSKHLKHAILGGGDIAFPLFFAGVILKMYGMYPAFIIAVTSTLALSWLLFRSEKNKFYPAMPVLSLGCFLGWGIVYLMV